MTRRILVLATTLLAASPAAAKTLAYEDNKLNFKTCNGDNVSARWVGGNLSLSQAGKSPGDPVPSVEFQTWDGGCATFQWNADSGALVIKQGDTPQAGSFLQFVAWDGARWAATRTGAGFYLARIADKDDADPKSRMKAAGEWVGKNNKLGVPAADLLAKGLVESNGG
jgi:hypothetical protein